MCYGATTLFTKAAMSTAVVMNKRQGQKSEVLVMTKRQKSQLECLHGILTSLLTIPASTVQFTASPKIMFIPWSTPCCSLSYFISSYPVNPVWHTKKLPLALLAALAHASLLPIKSDILKLGAQELKLALPVNKGKDIISRVFLLCKCQAAFGELFGGAKPSWSLYKILLYCMIMSSWK